ncbi:hypothetical protein BC332_11113 [Capsicum chinense]|nr:hypothetical protein BC332_11113 [Capsicum chinense]
MNRKIMTIVQMRSGSREKYWEYSQYTYLQVLCVLLLQNAGLQSKDISVRSMAIDLLGTIDARLKQDAVRCREEKFWIVKESRSEDIIDQNLPKDACSVCLDSRIDKSLDRCHDCQRMFSVNCTGIRGKTSQVTEAITNLEIVQQPLLNYLHDVATVDDLHLFTRCSLSSLMTRESAKKITLALGQNSSFSRGFDKILQVLLASLRENSPIIRAKALRAVSIIVKADPEDLGDKLVQTAVEWRFCDSAISARETALELVGRHIVSYPDVGLKYFEKLVESIKDTRVSMRKRAIKIIRDMSTSNANFSEFTTVCVEIISRVNDEESSVQSQVSHSAWERGPVLPTKPPLGWTGYPDEEAGQLSMAFVVRRPQSTVDKEQVIDFISKQVASYKKIMRVAFVSSITVSTYMNPLLKLQAKHRSQKIRDIKGQDMCLNTRCADPEFWLHIQERPLHHRILQYLSFCGFRGIVEVGNIPYDVGLISALVERWRPETHTFHLRIGEATITLQDIEIMFGMVVDGSPILLEGSTDLGIVARRQMMRDLTGWEPPLDCFSGIRRILVSKLAAYVKKLDDITDDTPKIEVWAWERIIPLQPAPHPLGANHHEASAPLARKWRRGIVHENEARNILVIIRDVLDNLIIEQFIWEPYSEEIHNELPVWCQRGKPIWMARVPLICGIVREWHMVDRVVRQFGYLQHVPGPCTHFHEQYFKHDNRNRITQEVLNMYNETKNTWDTCQEHIFEPHHINNQLEYIHWYCNYARMLIENSEHVVQRGYQHMTGRHEALVMGHETIYRMAQLILRDSRATSEMYGFVSEVARISLESMNSAYLGTRLSFAPNYAPPT